MWFFFLCLCVAVVVQMQSGKGFFFFAFFFAVYVGCAVIAHKIDGLAGADPSMPLSNSRERSQALFPRLLKGFFRC